MIHGMRTRPRVPQIELQTCDLTSTPFGMLEYVKIKDRNDIALSWPEVWSKFNSLYPDRWAISFFPPGDRLVDEANIYHLYVMPPGFHPEDADISNKHWKNR